MTSTFFFAIFVGYFRVGHAPQLSAGSFWRPIFITVVESSSFPGNFKANYQFSTARAVGGAYKNGCQLLAKWLLPPQKNDDDLKQELKPVACENVMSCGKAGWWLPDICHPQTYPEVTIYHKGGVSCTRKWPKSVSDWHFLKEIVGAW